MNVDSAPHSNYFVIKLCKNAPSTASLVHTTDCRRLCGTKDFSLLLISHQSSEHENAFYNNPRQNEASEWRNGFTLFFTRAFFAEFLLALSQNFHCLCLPTLSSWHQFILLVCEGRFGEVRLNTKKPALLGLSYLWGKLFFGSMLGWISFELLLSFH